LYYFFTLIIYFVTINTRLEKKIPIPFNPKSSMATKKKAAPKKKVAAKKVAKKKKK